MTIYDKLQEIHDRTLTQFDQAKNRDDLYQQKVQFLGKSGELTEVMKEMAKLPKEEKPQFGKRVNEIKQSLEASYEECFEKLKKQEIFEQMKADYIDLSLPATAKGVGDSHPVYLVMEEIVNILARLGYSLRLGPSIESDYYNFEALNIPKNHPARDMQDTFFIDDTHVLRTHTSPIQIHSLEAEELPLRIIGAGPVFRCDSDISHLPNFHQIEGMCVDKNISMADLKGTISFFVKEYFGADLKTRFRPSFFPFTEPSAEVDCQCPLCKGNGCSLCKQTGWIEIGGSGLINPKVLQSAKIKYPEWTGFAFGFGLERMAVIKYGIPDIRLLPENNLSFLKQF
ncbi:MAG: phenylalanine--tRNA ligase subunit alpha [Bdellovibrionales bacterium]|nr:phenylalanine--tRNA ligase subunit alpha [Bdellovibrionales bacterium]